MGLRMDDLHAPTVASGPASHPSANSSSKLPLRDLIAQKDNVEAELSALGSVLDSHRVDMHTPLTTPDGFPRADIDVAQIRTTRARIIRLKNDHKSLMKQLEEALHEQFAAGKLDGDIPMRDAPARAAAPASSTAPIVEPPFARVNTVVPASPSDSAGMKPGDKVTKFGNVNWTNHESLGRVAQVVQQNENRCILVKVLRESGGAVSNIVELQLIPRRDWGGRGLLGCHLVPL